MKQVKMLLLTGIVTLFTTFAHAAPVVNMAPIISYLLSDTQKLSLLELVAGNTLYHHKGGEGDYLTALTFNADATSVTITIIDGPNSGNSVVQVTSVVDDTLFIGDGSLIFTEQTSDYLLFETSRFYFDEAEARSYFLGDSIITHNGIDYYTVTSPYTGKVWLDRNLGATRVCNTLDDVACYGDYYQWGRNADGHEIMNSATTQVLADTIIPGHSLFILTESLGASQSSRDWLETPNDSLWSNNVNNPCPSAYHVPTKIEFENETVNAGITNNISVFNSFLKLPTAGGRGDWYDFNEVYGAEAYGYIWTSTVADYGSFNLYYNSGSLYMSPAHRSVGNPIRCIED